MYTLCIRYTLDPNRLKHFRDYVEHELEAIRNAGGKIVGYWLPTDFAGPTNIAYGLIDFLHSLHMSNTGGHWPMIRCISEIRTNSSGAA